MLKGKCFFPLLKLIKKIDLKQEMKSLIVDVTGKSAEEKKSIKNESGIDLVFVIVDKIVDAEKETWEFMTLYLEKTIEEVKEMDMFEIAEIIAELIKDPRVTKVFQTAIA
jgi:hypothetical protein